MNNLEEIEKNSDTYMNMTSLHSEDFEWLINRVKKLENTLKFYAIPGHMECDSGLQARKALEDK